MFSSSFFNLKDCLLDNYKSISNIYKTGPENNKEFNDPEGRVILAIEKFLNFFKYSLNGFKNLNIQENSDNSDIEEKERMKKIEMLISIKDVLTEFLRDMRQHPNKWSAFKLVSDFEEFIKKETGCDFDEIFKLKEDIDFADFDSSDDDKTTDFVTFNPFQGKGVDAADDFDYLTFQDNENYSQTTSTSTSSPDQGEDKRYPKTSPR